MSDMKLVFCGNGPDYDVLSSLINELDLSDRISIISGLGDEELIDFYNSLSVLCVPSLHEGLGLVTLEAQLCNTPVVYFEDAQIPEETIKCAISSKDVADMAVKIKELVDDPEYRDEVVRKGKEYADSFAIDFSDKIMEIYNN